MSAYDDMQERSEEVRQDSKPRSFPSRDESYETLRQPQPPEIPVELLPAILGFLTTDTDEHAQAALYQACLACYAFNAVAQPLLYRAPVIRGAKQPTQVTVARLLRTLQARPDLAHSVRSLPLGLWTAAMRDESLIDRRIVSKTALDLLDLCPHLEHLDFPWVTMALAHDTAVRIKRQKDLQSLTLGVGIATRGMCLPFCH